eukprot:TRINITY_DN2572_c0_g3_i1.p1 TRINITY_DN2572_c0_g3~~TRINITY_DN2572_c0_g3_i1.p1  ORF type:complete len:530 (+),score=144.49 TRINITY_DN2572_c0_g3_i1:89-1591(+)
MPDVRAKRVLAQQMPQPSALTSVTSDCLEPWFETSASDGAIMDQVNRLVDLATGDDLELQERMRKSLPARPTAIQSLVLCVLYIHTCKRFVSPTAETELLGVFHRNPKNFDDHKQNMEQLIQLLGQSPAAIDLKPDSLDQIDAAQAANGNQFQIAGLVQCLLTVAEGLQVRSTASLERSMDAVGAGEEESGMHDSGWARRHGDESSGGTRDDRDLLRAEHSMSAGSIPRRRTHRPSGRRSSRRVERRRKVVRTRPTQHDADARPVPGTFVQSLENIYVCGSLAVHSGDEGVAVRTEGCLAAVRWDRRRDGRSSPLLVPERGLRIAAPAARALTTEDLVATVRKQAEMVLKALGHAPEPDGDVCPPAQADSDAKMRLCKLRVDNIIRDERSRYIRRKQFADEVRRRHQSILWRAESASELLKRWTVDQTWAQQRTWAQTLNDDLRSIIRKEKERWRAELSSAEARMLNEVTLAQEQCESEVLRLESVVSALHGRTGPKMKF